MARTSLPALLPVLLILLTGAAAAAPWADAVPAGHWMAPLDAFEENLSISFVRERVEASAVPAEREAALREWQALLDRLGEERSSEKTGIEARYASGGLAPAPFNRAVEALRQRDRWLEGARQAHAIEAALSGPPTATPPSAPAGPAATPPPGTPVPAPPPSRASPLPPAKSPGFEVLAAVAALGGALALAGRRRP
ncbi:MAG: PGF-CTERM sorting domain-containing protein [Halobacteria archaeon]